MWSETKSLLLWLLAFLFGRRQRCDRCRVGQMKRGGESPLTIRHFDGFRYAVKMTDLLSGSPDPWWLNFPHWCVTNVISPLWLRFRHRSSSRSPYLGDTDETSRSETARPSRSLRRAVMRWWDIEKKESNQRNCGCKEPPRLEKIRRFFHERAVLVTFPERKVTSKAVRRAERNIQTKNET